ncbi:uncharacterized protein LOC126902090 [Daktulosphaira vitifoliae]|uniref:uncharacterized protein LOC126902090 n=1 Tax=Daktulosphaira vitifoliae TaxID=58002 RepID=UPI0021AA5ED2|nr:uncharacterized protein LOC126902090 [Daktulosphaira vitifoliae]
MINSGLELTNSVSLPDDKKMIVENPSIVQKVEPLQNIQFNAVAANSDIQIKIKNPIEVLSLQIDTNNHSNLVADGEIDSKAVETKPALNNDMKSPIKNDVVSTLARNVSKFDVFSEQIVPKGTKVSSKRIDKQKNAVSNKKSSPINKANYLYVGGIKSTITIEQINEKFSKFGNILNVEIFDGAYRYGKESTLKCGFVCFEHSSSVDKLLSYKGLTDMLSNDNKVYVDRRIEKYEPYPNSMLDKA